MARYTFYDLYDPVARKEATVEAETYCLAIAAVDTLARGGRKREITILPD